MPYFIVVVALWVGTNIERGVPSEPSIIPEKTNESKGLAPPWGMMQVLERTDFFRRKRQTAAVRAAWFLTQRLEFGGAEWGVKPPACDLPRSTFLHGIEELVVFLRRAHLVDQEFRR